MSVWIITKKIGNLDPKILGYRCYTSHGTALQAIFEDHSNWHRFPTATIDKVLDTEVLATSSFGTRIVYTLTSMLVTEDNNA